MHDDRIGFRLFEPFRREAVERVIFARRGEIGAVHALVLEAEHHHDVGVADSLVHVGEAGDVHALHRGRGERRRRDDAHFIAEQGERENVRARDAAVENVAADSDREPLDARSNILALTLLGNEVRVVAPPTLIPPAMERMHATTFTDMDEGIKDADVVMMLRLQNERMDGAYLPSAREYHALYGLTPKRLEKAKPDAIVMHPGPMNRGVEIDSSIADDPARSTITEQVEMGVAVRMACLDILTRRQRGVPGWN